MLTDLLAASIWLSPIALAIYYLFDLIATARLSRQYHEHPLVGRSSVLIPRCILNFIFGIRAVQLLQDGYKNVKNRLPNPNTVLTSQQFKHSTFRLMRDNGNAVVLPLSLLEELSALSPAIASPHGALEHDLLGEYTGLNLILDSRLHHSIVQRRLTPRLDQLTPDLEIELSLAIHDYLPQSDDWVEFVPYQIFARISARMAGRAMVGPQFCRMHKWLDISVNYTENLFRTIVVLRFFPAWTHSLICKLLPSYWQGQRYVRDAKDLLVPQLRHLIDQKDANPDAPIQQADPNVLTWLAETAKGRDRDPATLAHVEVLLALASVHTTLLRMVNVLYDLTTNPDLVLELKTEIEDVWHSEAGWTPSSYHRLAKLDSVMRESQRLSPPTTVGMKRLFKQSYTFSNGLKIPEGTYTCLPIYAIENDPAHTPNPTLFDGLRGFRAKEERRLFDTALSNGNTTDEFSFTSVSRTALNFGYGKSACPGRFFASLVIKILFVKLLCEYEFSFLSGQSRPRNITVHEFLFCWPWTKMRIRRKRSSISKDELENRHHVSPLSRDQAIEMCPF